VLISQSKLQEMYMCLTNTVCLIDMCTLQYSEKLVILQSIGIIVIKVEKQGQSSTPADILVDNLIPNSAKMTALVSLLFITMIPIDFKVTSFPYTCLLTFLVTIMVLVYSQAPLQKKNDHKDFLVGATPMKIKFICQ